MQAADILLPISLGLWVLGISRTSTANLGAYGLLPALPITVYLGVALLVVSAAIELTRDRPPSQWRMSAHVMALVFMLYGTAPLVYSEGRYSWLYKTIGIVQYIARHGRLNNQLDIYQNWPGFFALAAWFGKVAGVASPLSYAKWAQLVFELAALPILYVAYQALALSLRQRWLALLLYPAANWIGQDYYSPQALGTLLSLGIMALALRGLYMGNRDQFVDTRSPKGGARTQQSPEYPSAISGQEMWEAYYAVKGQRIPPGVDGVTIVDFERNLQNNLIKVRTLMSSGAYMPAPLRAVQVSGRYGRKTLGIPTLSDVIAQTIVARRLKAQLNDLASRRRHAGSVTAPRNADEQRQWSVNFDFDISVDNCPHSLIYKAVEATSQHDWEALCVRRWLKAPIQNPDGSLSSRYRNRGIQVGPTISAVLADLFLYYAIDTWLSRNFPDIQFKRDQCKAVAHCATEQRARAIREAVGHRIEELGVRSPVSTIRHDREGAGEGSYSSRKFRSAHYASRPTSDQSTELQHPRSRQGSNELLTGRTVRSATFAGAILLIFLVLTFTHELSPYILAIQIGVLAVARLVRPRLLAIALGIIALGYLLPRLSFVNSHYGLLSSIGSFFRNVRPPHTTGGGPIPVSQKVLYDCSNALSAIMWLMALVGAWMRRRSRRTALTLAFLAYSPILVLALQAYGNEGVLRVYLFSLPWTAALVASALAPSRALGNPGGHRLSLALRGHQQVSVRASSVRIAVVLGLVLTLFFPAFFGGDKSDVMSKSEVATVTAFMAHAPAGPVLLAVDNAPVSDTGRYNLFPLQTIFGSDSALGTRAVTPAIAKELAQYAVAYTHGRRPAYVLVSPSMIAANQAEPITPSASFRILLTSLAHSHWWKLRVKHDGTIIYEMPARHSHLPTPATSVPVPMYGLP